MFVFNAEKINSDIIRLFLEKYEQRCVQLCSIVRKGDKNDVQNIFVFSNSNELKSENDIFGVAYIDATILHCFPFLNSENENKDFDRAFLGVIYGNPSEISSESITTTQPINSDSAEKQIRCVNGEKFASEYIINLLISHGKKIYQKNEYFLMTKDDLDGFPLPQSLLKMGEEIICCNINHADDLLELQRQYLIEEVVPKGRTPREDYPKINIEKILKEQKVFAIQSNGEFVAKANTNAIGWNWIQIGGVYTNPLYRRNNYALCLVSVLGHHINKNGRKTCLFVNKKNLPAISLYKKTNFKTDCDFVICYFN